MKKVKVNSSILSAGKDEDGSLSALVSTEGDVLGYTQKYIMVRLDTGELFPFEEHELTEA